MGRTTLSRTLRTNDTKAALIGWTVIGALSPSLGGQDVTGCTVDVCGVTWDGFCCIRVTFLDRVFETPLFRMQIRNHNAPSQVISDSVSWGRSVFMIQKYRLMSMPGMYEQVDVYARDSEEAQRLKY